MENAGKSLFLIGLSLMLLAPLAALALYPKANWLFLIAFVGLALIVLAARYAKDPNPQEIAQVIQKLLRGETAGWDIDDYEHLNPKDSRVRELWQESMKTGGLPEKWPQLDDLTKNKLSAIADRLSHLK